MGVASQLFVVATVASLVAGRCFSDGGRPTGADVEPVDHMVPLARTANGFLFAYDTKYMERKGPLVGVWLGAAALDESSSFIAKYSINCETVKLVMVQSKSVDKDGKTVSESAFPLGKKPHPILHTTIEALLFDAVCAETAETAETAQPANTNPNPKIDM